MAEPQPSIEGLGDALLGSHLRRLELRIMGRLDELALQIEQTSVDREALEAAVAILKSADQTIDAIEKEGTS